MNYLRFFCNSAVLTAALGASAQLHLIDEVPPNPDNEPLPVFPVPSERQVQWNETEFYGFFHFGMNTFTGLEWGEGDTDPSIFQPSEKPDPRQWLEAIKAAGMQGGIAVVKHHDGFCLWPTETTDYNIIHAGNEAGRATNIPRDFGEAARDLGLKYGFYISPWDRNSIHYGDSTYVSDVFIKQCEEMIQYGPDQFEMWFDGANGGDGYYGGTGGVRKIDSSVYYNMPNLRHRIHSMMPYCVMWGLGGEARWIGNEAGWAGETCWSYGRSTQGNENAWQWNAGESDAKATSGGWFWKDDNDMRSLDQLWKMYLETVGRNSTFILNIPPNQTGKLPDTYVERLKMFGERLKQRLGTDLARNARVNVSETRHAGISRNYSGENLIDGDKDTYWAPSDSIIQSVITLQWDEPQNLHYVALQEYIRKGQRIRNFSIETSDDGETFVRRAENVPTTTVGYKRIIPLNGSTEEYGDGFNCKAIRITINDAKACPLLHTVSAY
ncbi:MAG: alpha-L-fucosidase [Bacteroides sp.]|nr:alpha-L-fucosidase [Bacteroides sp.]